MDQKSFFNGLINDKKDILQEIIDILSLHDIKYCVIGGLAVNAYVEPVVSLDLDIVILVGCLDKFINSVKDKFKIERFPHSVNLSTTYSDIRIQLQTDARYQNFIDRASIRKIMGYRMYVASLQDVLTGKIWAFSDEQRRGSKRQKDLADILRIVESFPKLKTELPESIIKIMSSIENK